MKALVLAYGDGDGASTTYRYRACQLIWAVQGHELEVAAVGKAPADLWQRFGAYDVIMNQKALLSPRIGRRVFAAGRPVCFDFDDAIWTRPRRPYSWWTQLRVNHRINFWLRRVRRIFAANAHLAGFARRYNSNVTVLPMALNLEIWKPRADKKTNAVRIGWSGSPGNLWHLEQLRSVLKRLVQLNPTVQVAIFCGQRPDLDFSFEHVPFAPGKEVSFVQGLDIGLLPLSDDAYSLGKSPIKALQYFSCAVPVVGNVRGATAEILNSENSFAANSEPDWVNALQRLIDHPAERASLGQAGRKFVERRHNLREVSRQLLDLLAAER